MINQDDNKIIGKRTLFWSTLSSFLIDQDNSFTESARSLVKWKLNRAAILIARKMRAVKPVHRKMT